ncbi:MAG: lysophospholipid acyltransferase family protein [Betaproteobacteria bacterium]|nr:lysophospholipid acyltransferase family protein [Betaproteobacteria bacterium]
MTFGYRFGSEKKAAHVRGKSLLVDKRAQRITHDPEPVTQLLPILPRLLAALPLWLLHALGVVVGWTVYLGSRRYRAYLKQNLAQAGFLDSSCARAAIAEAGKGVMELPAIWLKKRSRIVAGMREPEGWHLVETELGRGKGLIMLEPHLGCWEVAAQWFSLRHPITVLYSPPKVGWLEPLMRAGRDREMMKSVPADLTGVRALLRALKKGEAIGILPDQVPGEGEGEWVSFFGRPAYTMTLVARLAEKTGASVLIGFAERLPRGRGYHIHVERLPEPFAGESSVRRMNRAIEALVRRCPAQYLWAYNRYKVPAGVQPPETQDSGTRNQDPASRNQD